MWQDVFSSIIISQLLRPIEFKFSQVCYFVHMLRHTKWEDWSLTVTNDVQCLSACNLPWPLNIIPTQTGHFFSHLSYNLNTHSCNVYYFYIRLGKRKIFIFNIWFCVLRPISRVVNCIKNHIMVIHIIITVWMDEFYYFAIFNVFAYCCGLWRVLVKRIWCNIL